MRRPGRGRATSGLAVRHETAVGQPLLAVGAVVVAVVPYLAHLAARCRRAAAIHCWTIPMLTSSTSASTR